MIKLQDFKCRLNKEILKEDVTVLTDELALKSTSGKLDKWNTVKKYLLFSGAYSMKERQAMVYGESFKTITINLV